MLRVDKVARLERRRAVRGAEAVGVLPEEIESQEALVPLHRHEGILRVEREAEAAFLLVLCNPRRRVHGGDERFYESVSVHARGNGRASLVEGCLALFQTHERLRSQCLRQWRARRTLALRTFTTAGAEDPIAGRNGSLFAATATRRRAGRVVAPKRASDTASTAMNPSRRAMPVGRAPQLTLLNAHHAAAGRLSRSAGSPAPHVF